MHVIYNLSNFNRISMDNDVISRKEANAKNSSSNNPRTVIAGPSVDNVNTTIRKSYADSVRIKLMFLSLIKFLHGYLGLHSILLSLFPVMTRRVVPGLNPPLVFLDRILTALN